MAGVMLARRAALSCAIGTEGTFAAANVEDGDALIPVYDLTVATTVAQFARTPARGTILSHSSSIPGARFATLTFSTDFKGAGDPGDIVPDIDPLLRACGLAVTANAGTSHVYTTDNSAHECVDIAANFVDGSAAFRTVRLGSARGSFTLTMEVGQPVRANWTFMGVWMGTGTAGTDSTVAGIVDGSGWTLDQAYVNIVPPAFMGVTFTLAAAAIPCFTTCNLDHGAQLAMRGCAAEATGYKACDITGFNPTFSVNPLAQLAATYNPFDDMIQGTLVALSLAIGSTAGNIWTITAPQFQITSIGQQETDGLYRDQISGLLVAKEYDSGNTYPAVTYTLT